MSNNPLDQSDYITAADDSFPAAISRLFEAAVKANRYKKEGNIESAELYSYTARSPTLGGHSLQEIEGTFRLIKYEGTKKYSGRLSMDSPQKRTVDLEIQQMIPEAYRFMTVDGNKTPWILYCNLTGKRPTLERVNKGGRPRKHINPSKVD